MPKVQPGSSDSTQQTRSDVAYYVLAALAGAATGWADVTVNDLLFTALLVLMACMALGIARPRRPWRWVVIVGIFIPLTELAAFLMLAVKPTRGQIWGSFLAFLPGIAGSYGGSLLRGVADNLRQGK
jgi:ABC-type multidrug transport system permease subunit